VRRSQHMYESLIAPYPDAGRIMNSQSDLFEAEHALRESMPVSAGTGHLRWPLLITGF
jgi:hypothetical protein